MGRHCNRRLFPRHTQLSERVPSSSTKDEIRNPHISPKWYVPNLSACNFHSNSSPSNFIIFSPSHPNYPVNPPSSPVYPSGEVCISILHPPEDDKYGYESAAERWSPVQTPETILLSVISMLSSPNDESAANVEAGRMWREDPKEFKRRVRRCVRESLGED